MSDYIDRQAYIASLQYPEPKSLDSFIVGWIHGVTKDENVAKNAPAADVVPVVHGRWAPVYESEISGWNPAFAGRDPIGSYQCSCCGQEAVFDCNDEWVLSMYCPNCGARMDGECE